MRCLYHDRITPEGEQIGRNSYSYAAMKDRVPGKVAARLALEPNPSPERQKSIWNEEAGKVKAPVMFFDFTYSAPKSPDCPRR